MWGARAELAPSVAEVALQRIGATGVDAPLPLFARRVRIALRLL
jgi:hypothetical protein